MKTKDLILGVIAPLIIGLILSIIVMYQTEIKDVISNLDGGWIWFIVGCLFILFSIIYLFIWVSVRLILRQEIKEKKESSKRDLEEKKEIQKNFKDITDLLLKDTMFNNTICLCLVNKWTKEDTKATAKYLLSQFENNGKRVFDWENYRLPVDLIREINIIYHEQKAKDLKNESAKDKKNEDEK